MTTAKKMIETIAFAIGGVIGYLVGPCDALLQALLIFIVLDVVLGIISASCGKSKHSPSGKVSSQAMFVGLCKKAAELAMVVVGNTLDMVTGMSIVRSGVCVAIIVSEVISITETASLLGVIDIPIINKALDALKEGGEK